MIPVLDAISSTFLQSEWFLEASTSLLMVSVVSFVVLSLGKRALPTIRFYITVGVLLGIGIMGLFWWWAWLFTIVLWSSLLITLLIDGFLLAPASKTLEVTRHTPHRLLLGQPDTITLKLYNHSHQTLRLQLVDDSPHLLSIASGGLFDDLTLLPESGQTAAYTVTPTARGSAAFGYSAIRCQSPLGFLWLRFQATRPEMVPVYPDLKRIRQLILRFSKRSQMGELVRQHQGQPGTVFKLLRPYETGDDPRQMAWHTTAKLDKPVVKTYERQSDQPLVILLDTGRKLSYESQGRSKLDWALNATLSLAAVALKQGDNVSVTAFHQTLTQQFTIPAGKPSQFAHLLDRFAGIQPQSGESDYETVFSLVAKQMKRPSLVVVFTAMPTAHNVALLGQSLQPLSRHHQVILVTFTDDILKHKQNPPIVNSQTAYESAAALQTQQSREAQLHRLRQQYRIHVVESLPNRLDEAVIQQYLSQRQPTLIPNPV